MDLPKYRLGKRSPLGALVCAPSPPGASVSDMEKHSMLSMEEPPGRLGFLKPGQAGMAQAQRPSPQATLRGVDSFWSSSGGVPQGLCAVWPVSSSIDVPRSYRSPVSMDMDEMMAAMVLTSLSCSPVIQSPLQREPVPGEACGLSPLRVAGPCDSGGELSDSGSSGYWSLGRGQGSPAPSPCLVEADRGLATPTDEGLDMELDQGLFDEPAARKRKSSGRAGYRCLWPNCGKILFSGGSMKRHVRLLHLGGDSEQSRREEDFYYTDIGPRFEQSAAPNADCAPWTSSSSPGSPAPATGADPHAPVPSLLSQSAPVSFWQAHAQHPYQARAPVQLLATSISSASCQWTPLSPVQNRKPAPFRCRSVSVGEQWLQQYSAPCRPHSVSASPTHGLGPPRRARGEAKKCRKVYGVERRELWCTACRWKKACQRFLD